MTDIHATAIVSPDAKIGNNVRVGPFSIIHGNCHIGDDTVIESYCEIGYPTPRAGGDPLIIGKNCRIRSHSLFYEGSSITFYAAIILLAFTVVKQNQLCTSIMSSPNHAAVLTNYQIWFVPVDIAIRQNETRRPRNGLYAGKKSQKEL